MLTRLVAKGFKNLVDVDLYFGPLTCIAGPNGVGKSNLFDAIMFLQALADRPLLEAAVSVRGGRLAELISDFSPLRKLPAFQVFEEDLQRVLRKNCWF